MAKKNSRKNSSQNTDPRLRSFLRKAEAIIAAEKGLNAESRRKLQTLATHVKLPQELFEEALKRLQQNSGATSRLTHYEAAYVKFLDGQFANVAGGIISPRTEMEATELARRKYDINSTRAEQLIIARAKAAGLSLISRLEAESFADQTIADRVGSATLVSDERFDELYKIGRKWGLSQSHVDRIVVRETARNKKVTRPRSRIFIAISAAVFVISVALSATYYFELIPNRWLGQSNSIKTLPDEADSNANTDLSTRFPDSVSNRINTIGKIHPQLQSLLSEIVSDDPAQHRTGYRGLVQLACNEAASDQRLYRSLTCELYFADPDVDSAMEVISAIQDQWIINPENATTTVKQLRGVYPINHLIGELKFFKSEADFNFEWKEDRVNSLIRDLIKIPLDPATGIAEYMAASERAIATDQWNAIMRLAWSSPTQAAVLFQTLYDLSQAKLPPEILNVYRDDAIVSILETDNSRWRVLRQQLVSSVESCDESKLIEWISIFEKSDDERLRELLTGPLLARIDVHPKSPSQEDIAIAIENFGLQHRNQVLRPVIDRNELLEKFFENTMELESGEAGATISPDRIAQLALAVNVEWAFCAALENTSHIDDSSFAEFDRLISIPSPRLRELISLPIDRRQANANGQSSATASDKRRMNASLERLRDLEPKASSLRMLAIKQLNQIAHRFEGISYSDATILAEYLLSDLELEELLNVEKQIDTFAHWPNLLLAIADKLPESNVRTDQILTVVKLMLNRNIQIESRDWKRELQFKILTAVNSDVESQVDLDPDNLKSNWIRLKIYLAESYRERLAIASDLGYVDDIFVSPHQASARLVEELADLSNDSRQNKTKIKRAIQLVLTSPANEIEKTAFANQLLIESLAESQSQSRFSGEVNQLLADLHNKFRQPSLAGDQLYATELAVFQVINLKRKTLVHQLLNRDR